METMPGAILEDSKVVPKEDDGSIEYILLTFKVKDDMDPIALTVTNDPLLRHIVLTFMGREDVNEA